MEISKNSPKNKSVYLSPAIRICELNVESFILQSSVRSHTEDALDGLYL